MAKIVTLPDEQTTAERRAQNIALLRALADAATNMGPRDTVALAQRLKWSISDVGRVIHRNEVRRYIRPADVNHQYSLTPAGWKIIGRTPPLHMEEIA